MNRINRVKCFTLAMAVLLLSSQGLTAQLSTRTPLPTISSMCPIQLNDLHVSHNHLHFNYRNSSDKVLQGIVFGMGYFDSVQDPHRVFVVGGIDRHLDPGHVWATQIDIRYWRGSGPSGWTIWPDKILYTDGSTWRMGHEKNTCSVVDWIDKEITPLPLPAEVMDRPFDPR